MEIYDQIEAALRKVQEDRDIRTSELIAHALTVLSDMAIKISGPRDEAKQTEPEPPQNDEYLYAYVKSGRKTFPSHLSDVFRDWEESDHKRGDYVEHTTFRKAAKGATADDRQIARDYATPFDSDPE